MRPITATRVPRLDVRYPARLPVELVRSGGSSALTSLNVSFQGLSVETDQPVHLRHLVRMRMVLPTTQRLFVFNGMVARLITPDATGHGPSGFGALLYAVDREGRERWSAFVNHVRANPGEFALGLLEVPRLHR